MSIEHFVDRKKFPGLPVKRDLHGGQNTNAIAEAHRRRNEMLKAQNSKPKTQGSESESGAATMEDEGGKAAA